ncbi:hypothetical protein [Bosea sp. ANAM02]|uniref:hypothetical protein n=1 Tax=Bosea sp. ANAM02 TaxID=2020412 RepID=UPI00140EEE64|nr:hypothetical protein [Bosea sp. ANAM02]BCB22160.1 hypothetical protein OCUBac02_50540 [Bosea sp. ANAM02]
MSYATHPSVDHLTESIKFELIVLGLSDYEAELLAPLEAEMRSYVEGAADCGLSEEDMTPDLIELAKGKLQSLEIRRHQPRLGPVRYSCIAEVASSTSASTANGADVAISA